MPRIVLYAEGPGESGTTLLVERSPTKRIALDAEGPAHVLVRRSLVELSGHVSASIHFEWPLRFFGREVRGSDLLVKKTLRTVLSWPIAETQPDLAIVLVDQDGDEGRRTRLLEFVREPPLQLVPVVGVAVQEFEAWLLADHAAVNRVLRLTDQQGKDPEGLLPGVAKERLTTLTSRSSHLAPVGDRRTELARAADLKVVASKCRAFERFVADIRFALRTP